MANLQVVFLLLVGNNNAVTERSCFFVIGTLLGSPIIPGEFSSENTYFFL